MSRRGVYSSLKAHLGLCHAYDNATPGLGHVIFVRRGREVGHKLSGHGFYLIVNHFCVGKPPKKKTSTSRIPGVSLEKYDWKLFGIAVLIIICSSSHFYSGRLLALCSIRSLLGFHRPAGSNSDIMYIFLRYATLIKVPNC